MESGGAIIRVTRISLPGLYGAATCFSGGFVSLKQANATVAPARARAWVEKEADRLSTFIGEY